MCGTTTPSKIYIIIQDHLDRKLKKCWIIRVKMNNSESRCGNLTETYCHLSESLNFSFSEKKKTWVIMFVQLFYMWIRFPKRHPMCIRDLIKFDTNPSSQAKELCRIQYGFCSVWWYISLCTSTLTPCTQPQHDYLATPSHTKYSPFTNFIREYNSRRHFKPFLVDN